MYLDAMVKIPEVPGKITYRTKGDTTYVEYEYGRVYDKERQFTIANRKTIGKRSEADPSVMQPNENYMKFFPDVEMPDRTERSCGLQIGTWVVIRKIANDYGLPEILGRYLPAKDVGLFLDLAAYSIVEEDNRAQHYPSYAFKHPLFAERMRIYSDSRVSEFLKTMDEGVSASFLNEWNGSRNHREKIYFSYDSTDKKCQAAVKLSDIGI